MSIWSRVKTTAPAGPKSAPDRTTVERSPGGSIREGRGRFLGKGGALSPARPWAGSVIVLDRLFAFPGQALCRWELFFVALAFEKHPAAFVNEIAVFKCDPHQRPPLYRTVAVITEDDDAWVVRRHGGVVDQSFPVSVADRHIADTQRVKVGLDRRLLRCRRALRVYSAGTSQFRCNAPGVWETARAACRCSPCEDTFRFRKSSVLRR